MSTKTSILALLEQHRGQHLSGERIAGSLGVSRTAVWKAVKALERDGYRIAAAPNRGYALAGDTDILSVEGLLPHLARAEYAANIHIFSELESTNKTAKQLAVAGCAHGTAVLADAQTSGKGRHGRSFYSPRGGLYMSVVLHARLLDLPDVTRTTSLAAVAVCRAIAEVTGRQPQIKWVNDILLGGKKVCGILTEAVSDFESGSIDWIVVGIGINIGAGDFPPELSRRATSIFPGALSGALRNRLAAKIINLLLEPGAQIHAEYRRRMALLNRMVTVSAPNETYEALALDVDEAGRLIVQRADGSKLALSSGEVSVRQDEDLL